LRVRVGDPVAFQSGAIYHYVAGYVPGTILVRYNENGDLVQFVEELQSDRVLTAFNARPGDWWSAAGRECALQGSVGEKPRPYAGPAGRWSSVREIRYRTVNCADAGVETEVFADNIGMLRRVATTIAGPRTFDLVYAKIGGQVIENPNRGRFAVAVEDVPDQDIWRVTLRVDLGTAAALKTRFASGQMVDVWVRDAEGTVVHKWSDGRVFDQGVWEPQLGNQWSATVEVPRPAGSTSGYTIEGWLTTLGNQPRFAATVPAPVK
jgi:Intracellular proteinase inhibitor